VWESGATPVVVLTKSDLATDKGERLTEVERIALGAEVIVTSAYEHSGMDRVREHIRPAVTMAFIGSSGVGKSTLVNTLVGAEVLATKGLRNDGQGRHTTTHREAILLPGGGVLIDTPGMRELGLESADIDRTFSDIEELAARCRFADCGHQREPGCAVQAAVRTGDLDGARLANWRKLGNEVHYTGKSNREINEMKLHRIFGGKAGQKAARKEFRSREKNRAGF
jgi:ribosome biogenesis GTPase